MSVPHKPTKKNGMGRDGYNSRYMSKVKFVPHKNVKAGQAVLFKYK